MKRIAFQLILLFAVSCGLNAQTPGPSGGNQGHAQVLSSPAFTSSPGQAVWLGCSSYQSTNISLPTDNKNNTWTQLAAQNTTGGGRIALFRSVLANTGANHILNCNYPTATDAGLAFQAFSGLLLPPVDDGTAAATGTGVTPAITPIVPNYAGDVIITAITYDGAPTATPGTGFTSSYYGSITSYKQPVGLAFQILTGTPAVTGAWKLSASKGWAVAVALAKASTAGLPPVTITSKFTYDDGTAVSGSVRLYKVQASGVPQQIANVALDSTGKAVASVVLDPTAQYQGVLLDRSNNVLQQVWSVPLSQVLNQSVIATLAAGQLNVIVAKADNSIKNVSFTSQ